MPFNGNSLVDGLASGLGTVTGWADKLFYLLGNPMVLRVETIQ